MNENLISIPTYQTRSKNTFLLRKAFRWLFNIPIAFIYILAVENAYGYKVVLKYQYLKKSNQIKLRR